MASSGVGSVLSAAVTDAVKPFVPPVPRSSRLTGPVKGAVKTQVICTGVVPSGGAEHSAPAGGPPEKFQPPALVMSMTSVDAASGDDTLRSKGYRGSPGQEQE